MSARSKERIERVKRAWEEHDRAQREEEARNNQDLSQLFQIGFPGGMPGNFPGGMPGDRNGNAWEC